ncbi:vomeronasal type-2 receptor 26-like [Lissotriton helveticus]
MLLDSEFQAELREECLEFFKRNKDSVQDVETIWDAFKATLRGLCISKGSGVLKSILNRLKFLESDLRKAEETLRVNPGNTTLAEIRGKLSEYSDEASREVKFRNKYWVARCYGEGERPGKALAATVKLMRSPTVVLELETAEGLVLRDTTQILNEFVWHYSTLYSSTRTGGLTLDDYLADVSLGWLSDSQRAFLSAPFELDEVREAIMHMKSGKATGLDGIPIEFYKTFIDFMAPVLREVYEDALEVGHLPASMRIALITSLLKPGKPATNCDSYRPLSLLNCDVKILAKLIAARISLLLPDLVLPDQAGFVPGRATSHNLRTFFSVYDSVSEDLPMAAIFLDATKAFDSLEWDYVFKNLLLHDTPIKLVSTLYKSVRANMTYTDLPARKKWEQDLATTLTDRQWEFCLQQTERISSSSRAPSQTYQGLQAMMFAVKEINHNINLLPNITLGFQIYDSCRVLQRSLQGTLWMLTGQEKPVINFCCQRELPLMGIIGDAGSSSSIVMARLLGLYRFPQISYVSTSPLLSNRNQFPSFFRTITNDDLQAQGLAQLLVHFGWTWVGILIEDNDYGQQGYHLLKQELAKAGACIAFSETIILSRADRNAFHIIQVIKNSTANAIVLFSSDAGLVPLIDQMILQNVSGKVFIASEGWSTSATLAIEKYNDFLSGTIGIAMHSGEIPGFKEHLDAINPFTSPDNVFLPEFWEDVFNCKWPPQNNSTTFWDTKSKLCTGHEKIGSLQNDFNDGTNLRSSYNVYNAVYASAWSLHDLIFCQSHKDSNSKKACADINNYQPWQVPISVCSQSCIPGFRKAVIEGEPVCCFQCIRCPQGEISNETDSTECNKCSWDQWPNAKQDLCILKDIEFLSYEGVLGYSLAAICIFLSVIPTAILGLFFHFRSTPIVKANNRSLSYLLLLSLTLCFLCSFAFIGYPTSMTCLVRQASFGIIFALCVSCVLAKTVMVVIAFNATKPGSTLKRWATPKLSYAVVNIGTLLQVLLCVFWLILSPPFLVYNIQIQPGLIIVECNEGASIAFWCMLGYLGLLATISFVVAFLARKLPDSFNETKFITFSMLAFLSVWISFIPAYLSTKGKYMVAMEVFAILTSSSALVTCIFFPKCYIILLRPEMNSKEHLMGRKQ